MKKTSIATFLTTFFILTGNAYAKGGYALAQKHMCTVCHSLDRKLMGPTWMNISLRYQNQPDAEAYLISKIRDGSSGVWGTAVMPPSMQLSAEDIKILADYVLKLSKE
jgi:cytochrome c